MKNDYLIEKKENIFTKILDFFKRLFKKENLNKNINENSLNNISDSISNNMEKNDYGYKDERSGEESEFLNYLRIDKKEDPALLELQSKFENKEVLMSELSDEELIKLNELYIRQIDNMKRELENKKTKIGMLKFKLSKQILN